MPKVSRESAAQVEDHGPVEDRHEDVTATPSSSCRSARTSTATPLVKGLPGDACPCPHWGYVVKGR